MRCQGEKMIKGVHDASVRRERVREPRNSFM